MVDSPDEEARSEIQYDIELDLQMLREDLAAELLAINQYQGHIESLADKEAIRVLVQIRDGKKEDVARLIKLIHKLDSVQFKKMSKER